jgi:hypothetical protein
LPENRGQKTEDRNAGWAIPNNNQVFRDMVWCLFCYAEEMNNMQNYKILFQDISWEHPLKGARFKACEQDGKTIRLVEFTQ